MNLSRHFTLEEMTRSEYAARNGLSNVPDAEQVNALTQLCLKVLEPLRASLQKPIGVTSGYRAPAVNAGVGGSTTSQHMKGEAADINVENMSVEDLFQFVKSNYVYDQLIQEFNAWVHVSWDNTAERQRGSILRATKENGKTLYTPEPR